MKRHLSAIADAIRGLVGNRQGLYGFTLFEVIVVLFIIGIITAVVIARIPSMDAYMERVESDTVKSHLRYAQYRAMNSDKEWGVDFTSSSAYRLYYVEAGTQYSFFPALESIGTVTMSTLRMQAPVSVRFDELGSPGTADVSLKTSDGSELCAVTAETGFIK